MRGLSDCPAAAADALAAAVAPGFADAAVDGADDAVDEEHAAMMAPRVGSDTASKAPR